MESGTVRSLLVDASHFYDSPELSDVTIVLVEEFEDLKERPAKRQRTGDDADGAQDAADAAAAAASGAAAGEAAGHPTLRLHGHRFQLSACSSVFRAQIARWSAGDNNELVLHVPSLEVGQLLIRSLYQAQPQLQECSQQQLLELILLADSLDDSKAAVAASGQLQRIAAQGQLEWHTAVRIMSLPAACPEMPAYKPLFEAAAALIQQELRFLEPACSDISNKRFKLLQLPHMALVQLLSSEQLRVESENTVVYAIQLWAQAQQPQPSLQQMQQLCDTMRIAWCSPLYVATVLPAWPLLAQCFAPQELALANMLAASSDATEGLSSMAAAAGHAAGSLTERLLQNQLRVQQVAVDADVVQQRRAWLLPCRTVDEGGEQPLRAYQHSFPLSALEEAVEATLARAAAGNFAEPAAVAWQLPGFRGRTYTVRLHAVAHDASAPAPVNAAADAAADAAPAAGVAAAVGALAPRQQAAGGAAAQAEQDHVAAARGPAPEVWRRRRLRLIARQAAAAAAGAREAARGEMGAAKMGEGAAQLPGNAAAAAAADGGNAAAAAAAAGGGNAAALAPVAPEAGGVSCTLQLSIGHGADMPAGARGLITYRAMVLTAAADARIDGEAPGAIRAPWLHDALCDSPCKHAGIFRIGSFGSYAECERKLRAKGLVHPDGTLKMQLLIRRVQ